MVSGVICEFNPFHNGHLHLIDNAKKNGSNIICVMSGNFVQRGEIALYEKHIRARSALLNGADLIINLPVGWSMSGAENFAIGGISLLKDTGIVDRVVFGCENDDLELLKNTADFISSNEFSVNLKNYISKGLTFASARKKAVESFSKTAAEILCSPNNILAVEYIRAAEKLGFNTDFFSVLRIGTSHNSLVPKDNFSSASAIREMIKNNEAFENYIPKSTYDLLMASPSSKFENIENAILFMLRSLSLDDLKKIPDISEGIENRIYEKIKTALTFEDLLMQIKTKRYTLARIRRILMSAAFGIDNSFIGAKPPYIQILGYNNTGKELLSEISKKSPIPLLVSSKDLKKLDDFGKKVFEVESTSTDLYSLAFDLPLNCGNEFTIPVVKV